MDCKICGRDFVERNTSEYFMHIQHHSNNLLDKYFNKESQKYECDICNCFKIASIYNFYYHMRLSHKDKFNAIFEQNSYHCNIVQHPSYRNYSSFRSHVYSHGCYGDKKIFTCSKCGKTYTKKYAKMKHEQICSFDIIKSQSAT